MKSKTFLICFSTRLSSSTSVQSFLGLTTRTQSSDSLLGESSSWPSLFFFFVVLLGELSERVIQLDSLLLDLQSFAQLADPTSTLFSFPSLLRLRVIACYKIIPALTNVKEAVFSGWFGPIGVGACFYIQVALEKIPDDGTRNHLREVYSPVVLFLVFSSILTHGVTIPISKLGPTVVRRTATLSKTISRPTSRTNSISEGENRQVSRCIRFDAFSSFIELECFEVLTQPPSGLIFLFSLLYFLDSFFFHLCTSRP